MSNIFKFGNFIISYYHGEALVYYKNLHVFKTNDGLEEAALKIINSVITSHYKHEFVNKDKVMYFFERDDDKIEIKVYNIEKLKRDDCKIKIN